MSDPNNAPPPSAPTPPEPAPRVALGRQRQTVRGSILEWRNWRVLMAKVAKAHAFFAMGITGLTVIATIMFAALMGSFSPMVLVVLPLAMLLAFPIGLISGYLTMLLIFWPVKGTLRLLDWRPAEEPLALFCGALVGLIWAIPSALNSTPLGVFEIAISLASLAGNIMAGQVGAVLAMTDRFRNARDSAVEHPVEVRFNLRTLLIGMIPLCLVLTLFRWLDLLRVETLVIILAWALLQYLTRRPAVRLTLWWLDRRGDRAAAAAAARPASPVPPVTPAD